MTRTSSGFGGLAMSCVLTSVACGAGSVETPGEPDVPGTSDVAQALDATSIRVERLLDGPIIGPGLHPSIGENIQGPSLIRVPDWVEAPLGAYYLYFADHKGRYIRLAYADDPLGPWKLHPPGSLQIEQSHFPTEPPEPTPEQMERYRAERPRNTMPHDRLFEATAPHIASPDVHVDDENRRIIM